MDCKSVHFHKKSAILCLVFISHWPLSISHWHLYETQSRGEKQTILATRHLLVILGREEKKKSEADKWLVNSPFYLVNPKHCSWEMQYRLIELLHWRGRMDPRNADACLLDVNARMLDHCCRSLRPILMVEKWLACCYDIGLVARHRHLYEQKWLV